MAFRFLADATVVLHLAFVVFAVAGGLLVLRWPRVAWGHLPSAAWGAWVEFAGWICPLTHLENWFRLRGGESVYTVSFVDQYVMPILYPAALTRDIQWALGGFVVAVNVFVYLVVWRRIRRSG
jgi:uncharacterized protein DUF2784